MGYVDQVIDNLETKARLAKARTGAKPCPTPWCCAGVDRIIVWENGRTFCSACGVTADSLTEWNYRPA